MKNYYWRNSDINNIGNLIFINENKNTYIHIYSAGGGKLNRVNTYDVDEKCSSIVKVDIFYI